MARTLRIVNYAVNGAGVGHLVRLIAINRWIRRYAWHAGVRPEIYFLTSSEADGLLFTEGFASFKMPSKTSVAETGIDKLAYLALAKQWVWHSLGLLRPDILVVDTFPRGSFGELLSALDLCRHRAFVYRPLKAAFAARPDFQAMLPLYDAIVVPEHAGADVTIPDEARGRVRFVGPVMARERAELLARGEARARCGVREGCVVVYLSAGGGGDPGAAETLAALVDALAADETLHLVVGAGPLYRGQPFAGSRLTWLPTGLAAELMGAFDAAICASGYNSYHELMHAGVPAIFLPQAKVADVQGERARRAVDAGAAVMLDPGSDARAIRSALGELREKLPEAAAAARALVPRNHARDAAAEILRLALSPGEVDAAEEAVSDAVLEAERAGIPAEASIETMRLLAGETAPARRDAAPIGEEALGLLAFARDAGVPAAEAVKLAVLAIRKLSPAPFGEMAVSLRAMLGELAPFQDWPGAALLLRGIERPCSPAAMARDVARAARAIRDRGLPLALGAAALASEGA